MLIIVTVAFATIIMLSLAILMGYILGWANRAFYVEVDPRIESINAALPAVNCGGCGFIGCQEYAEAIVKENAPITRCAPGGASSAEAIAKIMGLELLETVKLSPVIHCCSDKSTKLGLNEYKGITTCRAANMVSGIQGCSYGCLGFGDCFNACNYGAITIKNGLAVINYEKCVGCGACAKTCPRTIISMVPFKVNEIAVVACSNKDFIKETRSVCTLGCIACKACTKVNSNYKMTGNLARLDYDSYDISSNFDAAIAKCPRKCILPAGIPAQKHPIKDEEVPVRIDADFKSSVEDSEWRG